MNGQKISRKTERLLMVIAGLWQIFNGVITIYVYAPYHRRAGLDLIDYSVTIIEAEAISQVFANFYMFIVIYGMIYMVIGLLLVYLSRKMTDNKVTYAIPITALVIGLAAYFGMDIMSVVFCSLTGVLALAKNKSIKIASSYSSELE